MPKANTENTNSHRTAKRKQPPDGKLAFNASARLEEDLRSIERFTSCLRLMANGASDEMMSDALYAISDGIESIVEQAIVRQGKIFHATWGFAFGEPETPASVVLPPSPEQIANLESLLSEWKREAKKAANKTNSAKAA